MWKPNTKLRMIEWRYDKWENTNRTAFIAAITSQTLHDRVWSWNITYWKVIKFQLHYATETMTVSALDLKKGVVCEIWDSQSSVVKDTNLLGYYVASDSKQLLIFCTCIVLSSLGSNSPTRVFFCHLLSLTSPTAQDIIIQNHGNCLPVDMA